MGGVLVSELVCAMEGWMSQREEQLEEGVWEWSVHSFVRSKGLFGTHALPLFRLAKRLGMPVEVLAKALGGYLLQSHKDLVSAYQYERGYLNIRISPHRWLLYLKDSSQAEPSALMGKEEGGSYVVEYSSPNTNKPLHLGHLRNIFIGEALSNLHGLSREVYRVSLVNDRGIHICKSMVAYASSGDGEVPSKDMKGDALVGKYYVVFERMHQRERKERLAKGLSAIEAEKTSVMESARAMLMRWEQGDGEVRALWQRLNAWVLEGMSVTYARLGVRFDREYKESAYYEQGRAIILDSLSRGVCYRKSDGSVCVDLGKEGLGEKVLLRSDGTSVYITQDVGIAAQKYKDYSFSRSYYVVGDEQRYHFEVLFHLLEKLGVSYASGVRHISYGMVFLPAGKMKSREGTVVDADGLLDDLERLAREKTMSLGKVETMDLVEREALYKVLALGAIRYYLLKVSPAKSLVFTPDESLDLQGDTGIFLQYTHARICALLRRAKSEFGGLSWEEHRIVLSEGMISEAEEGVLSQLSLFSSALSQSKEREDPSLLARYVYHLARQYSRWYVQRSVFSKDREMMIFRLLLSHRVAECLRSGAGLLGIALPERM